MPNECPCKEEESLYREALEEAAKEKDETVRLRCIETVRAMHDEITKTFLSKACKHCQNRSC